ncbi:Sulfite exporter TauE/SafE [compost metagenome]
MLAALSASHLSLFVGASTIAAALVTLMMPAFSPGRTAFVAAGLVTGVTETATGIGGPPLALVYQHQPAPTMRSTIALCFLVGELVSLATLMAAGRIDGSQLYAAALLLPALVVGAVLSRVVHRRINGRVLRIFVQVFAIVSGAALLLHSF